MESLAFLIVMLCFGVPCILGLAYLPVAMLVLFPIRWEDRPDLFDVRAVVRELVAPPLRWLQGAPALPRRGSPFATLGLSEQGCTEAVLDGVLASWTCIMDNGPWSYPVSQRSRLRACYGQALFLVQARDVLRTVFEEVMRARAHRQAEQAAQAGPARTMSPAASNWRQVLELPEGEADVPRIKRAYRKLAAQCHPDRGGSNDAMARLNAAFARARKELAFV
jgi:hypothetical protein